MITAIQSAPTAAISQRISLPFCSPRSAPPNLLGGSTGCTLGTAIGTDDRGGLRRWRHRSGRPDWASWVRWRGGATVVTSIRRASQARRGRTRREDGDLPGPHRPRNMNAIARETEPETLAGAIDQLARRGFTQSLSVTGNRLRVVETRKTFGPEDVVIREYRRFEGVSDPDDMSIVYAIEALGGTRGTLVDAYGVYSDPDISMFLSTVPIRGTTR